MKKTIVSFFLLITLLSEAQNCVTPDMINTTLPPSQGIQWQRLFGGSSFEDARGITALSDTSFVTIVQSSSQDGDVAGASGDNAYAIKYLTNGTMVWKKEIGGSGLLSSIAKAENGSVITVGSTSSKDGAYSGNHGYSDVLLTKLDNQGNIVWLKTLGGSFDEGGDFYIQRFRDNQYVVLARTSSKDGNVINPFPDFSPRYWLFCIDKDGNIIWQKVLDHPIYVADMQVTPDFKFIMAGTKTVNSKTGGIILKIDSTGAILFSKEYSNNERQLNINSIISNPDNTFTFTGFVQPIIYPGGPSCLGDHGGNDAWVGKTDNAGNLLWQKFYGGANSDVGVNIIPANDGGYLLTGLSASVDGNASGSHDTTGWSGDGWIVKLDNNGSLVWQKMVGGNTHEGLEQAIQLANNDFIIVGNASSYNNGDVFGSKGESDAWVFKIGASNTILGTVFFDINGNHIKDNNESYFTNGTVKSLKGDLGNSSDIKNGLYAVSVDTGTYVTQPVISSPYYNPFPVTATSRFDNYFKSDTINFAMVPIAAINDLRIAMLPVTAARPGFKAQYHIKYENTGTTTIANGFVKLVKDSSTVFESASITPSLLTGDTVIWNFNNFEPMRATEFSVNLKLKVPPILNNGDTLHHYVTINPLVNDTTSLNNQADIKQIVTGSFDPNDKTETHGPGFEQQRLSNGEYLNYVIRFQNTGTDTAFRVLVRDTLSNKMDWNSFEMISASHTYRLSVTDQNKLEWKFDPIILPDSNHNVAASNGYVAFRIKPKSNLVQGDIIANRAGIYFDFNMPVITNLQETVISGSSFSKPVISGLDTVYCRKPRVVIGKITNSPQSNTGIIMSVKLDNTTLAVAGDGSFNFDVSSLTAGSHIISVKFILANTTTTTESIFRVTEPALLNLNLSANSTNVTSSAQSVTITGVNASRGSNLHYAYARDRSFTNILQSESSTNTITIDPGVLTSGINWIYGRISANGQCYTEETNIDSIQLNVNTATVAGIVDVDAPGQSINIYPVPFKDHLLLKGFSITKNYEVILVNAQGNRMNTAIINNRDSYEFKTSGLAAGVYIIQVFKDGNKLGAVAIIKQ